MSENTAKKQVTAKLTGDYATVFDNHLLELQKENPQATARQLIEKLLDEKTVFTIAEDAEGIKTELDSRNKYVFELQTEISNLQETIQTLNDQLADAADKNAKLVALVNTTGLNFSEAETEKITEACNILSELYGETVGVEDLLRLFMVNATVNSAKAGLSPSNKQFLTEAREKFATLKLV